MGYGLHLAKKKFNAEKELISRMYSRKLKLALGATYGMPLNINDKRLDKEIKNTSDGFGITGMVMLDLSSQLSVFGSATVINSDTDGRGFLENGDRVPANLHDRTFWFKVGIAYNLVGF